jgi:multiple sugar transport system substrate-binding protein
VATGALALLALVLVAGACSSGDDDAVPTLSWYTYDEPGGSFTDAAARCTEAAEGRYRIELSVLPTDASQQRELLVRRLAAGDSSIDLMSMDVTLTPEFARAGWILPWSPEDAAAATEGRLQGAVDSASYLDELWAAPFTGNAQLLWYRTDRAPEAPATWDEMFAEAEAIGPGGGIVTMGARYEGLTVLFNSLLESAGGSILDEDGTEVALPEEPTRLALETMRALGTSPAASPALPTAQEDDARLGFESGDATFELNWPFVYPSAQSNAPDIGEVMAWAPWPSVVDGEPSHVTYGGFNLGVGAFTDHPDEAFEAATCIADEQGQRAAAIQGGLAPTSAALYDDPEVREAYPFADTLREALDGASQRPQSPVYADISLAIQRTLHPMSSIDPDGDVERLRSAIDDALESRGLL